eukprot:PhM_4_TR3029/c0_g2_i9/m.41362
MTAWNQTLSVPKHIIFSSMNYNRAVDWVKHWKMNAVMSEGVCLDMHDTHSDGVLVSLPSMSVVELTLPSMVPSFADRFLYDCRRLTYLDMASLSNVSEIGAHFLEG